MVFSMLHYIHYIPVRVKIFSHFSIIYKHINECDVGYTDVNVAECRTVLARDGIVHTQTIVLV